MERAAGPGRSAAPGVRCRSGQQKSRGPDPAHDSWRLVGGPAAVPSARDGHRSPVNAAVGRRSLASRDWGVDEEMHCLQVDPRGRDPRTGRPRRRTGAGGVYVRRLSAVKVARDLQ